MRCPLVSIIIPCFNARKYIGAAIQSALDQTYPNIEVIVVDDGSTDDSLGVIQSFGDRIRWETGPNRGGCAARNRGIAISRGEFLQFLDADDLLYREKLERQVNAAGERNGTLIFCDAESDGPPHPHHVRQDVVTDAVVFMLQGGLQTSAMLHRRDWIERIGGFREDLPCAQERDLQLRLAAAGAMFERLPEKHYFVRHVPQSVSSNIERVLDQHAKILWPGYRDLESRGAMTDERRKAFAGLLACDARRLMTMGRREKAADYFRQAASMHPTGGLDIAYGKVTRGIRRVAGPVVAEYIGSFTRWIVRAFRVAGGGG